MRGQSGDPGGGQGWGSVFDGDADTKHTCPHAPHRRCRPSTPRRKLSLPSLWLLAPQLRSCSSQWLPTAAIPPEHQCPRQDRDKEPPGPHEDCTADTSLPALILAWLPKPMHRGGWPRGTCLFRNTPCYETNPSSPAPAHAPDKLLQAPAQCSHLLTETTCSCRAFPADCEAVADRVKPPHLF